jgi:DNA invertase Pin-like site-specific DNA recombinase
MTTKTADSATRAVAYYRSSLVDADRAIDNQREQVREWAEKHGLEIIREFVDAGTSGLPTEPREAFDKLMRYIKRCRRFRYVLCPDTTRWGRDHGMNLPELHSDECLRAGKTVIYTRIAECQNPNPLRLVFEYYRRMQYNSCRRQGDKIRRARAAAASQGYWPGGKTPYGLRRLLLDGDENPIHLLEPGQRKTIQKQRVALVLGEPAQVAAVRRVFREFVDRGYRTARIADGLNAKRIPSPGGSGWNARQVLACLRTEAYANSITYRRKTSRGGNTPDGWVRMPKAREGIISRELFERAQAILMQCRRRFDAAGTGSTIRP